MEHLSAQQRQSLALAFFQGLSHAEVAEQMRQPLGTVKSWVRRALLSLKSCLEGPSSATSAARERLTWTTAAPTSPIAWPPTMWPARCAALRGAASRRCCRRIPRCARPRARGRSG